MKDKAESNNKILGKNRRAFYEYTVDDRIEAGIVLTGTEVKSLRLAHFNFSDAYARIKNNELWLMSFHINPFKQGNMYNHDPDQPRKLLVHRQELVKLQKKVDERGFTLVPLSVYLKNGRVKVEIGICKGKKDYDKRETIKERDAKRDNARVLKDRFD